MSAGEIARAISECDPSERDALRASFDWYQETYGDAPSSAAEAVKMEHEYRTTDPAACMTSC
jgi:hypothetical protein